jgi:ABC-type iron transport system FetAB permease component
VPYPARKNENNHKILYVIIRPKMNWRGTEIIPFKGVIVENARLRPDG